jgi:hypothetical protein
MHLNQDLAKDISAVDTQVTIIFADNLAFLQRFLGFLKNSGWH